MRILFNEPVDLINKSINLIQNVMKKSIVLFGILFLFSCSKDKVYQKLSFIPTKIDGTASINYDSIAYTTITYSDLSNDADTHTVSMNVLTDYLKLISGHSYSFKKFDMVDISGKVKYFVPSKSDTLAKNILYRLPIWFTIPEDSGAGLVLSVAPYPF